jgi:hypothetical protein
MKHSWMAKVQDIARQHMNNFQTPNLQSPKKLLSRPARPSQAGKQGSLATKGVGATEDQQSGLRMQGAISSPEREPVRNF